MTKISTAKKRQQSPRHCLVGTRDTEIMMALDRCPLTTQQLLRVSETFQRPFTDVNNLRRRLRRLSAAGYLRSWPYAVATNGRSPYYFKLSRTGYRLLYGADSPLPKRRQFEAISPAHHHHTFCLAGFIVHLVRQAHRAGATIEHFARENSVQFEAGPYTLRPDCSFVIRYRDRTFPFVVELDNSTERVRSKLDTESIERKLRGYDAHQAKFDKFDPNRYLVLFITTRSEQRLQNILRLATEVMQQPQRTVFVGSSLNTFLASDPFREPVLQDHRGLKRCLVPVKARPLQ